MARLITLTFTHDLNDLVQVDDIIFFKSGTEAKRLGTITVVNTTTKKITVSVADNVTTPAAGTYYLFAKDNKANLSSALGYYAEVKMSTNAIDAASELHKVGIDMFTSSK